VNREFKSHLVHLAAPGILNHAHGLGWCAAPKLGHPKQPKGRTAYFSEAQLTEALRLVWSNVDLKARRVDFLNTKNGEHRGVPFNQDAFLALAGLPHREGQVFRTPAGAAYYDSGGLGGSPIKRAFKTACGRAGIDGLRVHDLRHTFAS
jgi:integrase